MGASLEAPGQLGALFPSPWSRSVTSSHLISSQAVHHSAEDQSTGEGADEEALEHDETS